MVLPFSDIWTEGSKNLQDTLAYFLRQRWVPKGQTYRSCMYETSKTVCFSQKINVYELNIMPTLGCSRLGLTLWGFSGRGTRLSENSTHRDTLQRWNLKYARLHQSVLQSVLPTGSKPPFLHLPNRKARVTYTGSLLISLIRPLTSRAVLPKWAGMLSFPLTTVFPEWTSIVWSWTSLLSPSWTSLLWRVSKRYKVYQGAPTNWSSTNAAAFSPFLPCII